MCYGVTISNGGVKKMLMRGCLHWLTKEKKLWFGEII